MTTATSAWTQGTWIQAQCLKGANTHNPCRATPAWGQSGLQNALALAAAAGPGNLNTSLVKAENLPVGTAPRAQTAAVMLAYLDTTRDGPDYRWFGPVVPVGSALARVRAATTAAAANSTAATLQPGAPTTAAPVVAAPAAAPETLKAARMRQHWLIAAQGEDPDTRSAAWWLGSPYLGDALKESVNPYQVLRFLAANCPQLEGKVAPNAWTRCTR